MIYRAHFHFEGVKMSQEHNTWREPVSLQSLEEANTDKNLLLHVPGGSYRKRMHMTRYLMPRSKYVETGTTTRPYVILQNIARRASIRKFSRERQPRSLSISVNWHTKGSTCYRFGSPSLQYFQFCFNILFAGGAPDSRGKLNLGSD